MKISEFQGTYRFLSNMWPAPIFYDGVHYPTTEHAFVASKTDLIGLREDIAQMQNPKQVKVYGRSIKLREGWEDMKLDVMLDINRLKYQIPDLKERLLSTGSSLLEEGNLWGDRYWGISPPDSGNGKNHLGLILMRIREELGGMPYSEEVVKTVTPTASNQETRQLLLDLAYSVVDRRR